MPPNQRFVSKLIPSRRLRLLQLTRSRTARLRFILLIALMPSPRFGIKKALPTLEPCTVNAGIFEQDSTFAELVMIRRTIQPTSSGSLVVSILLLKPTSFLTNFSAAQAPSESPLGRQVVIAASFS